MASFQFSFLPWFTLAETISFPLKNDAVLGVNLLFVTNKHKAISQLHTV